MPSGGRLVYEPPSTWHGPTLRFEPEGLVIVGQKGALTVLDWDGTGAKWHLTGVVASRANRAGIRVSVREPQPDVWHPSFGTRDTWLPSTWSMPPLKELPALVEYLASTPPAREGLADRSRVESLVADLASRGWEKPAPPEEPLLGDRLDMHVAVNRALESLGWRRFQCRPVRGEVKPDVDVVAAGARRSLATGVSTRIRDDDLARMAKRHLETAPWPFDVLMP